jgi:N6-adenosine-specific RNA methylase IME4
MAEIRWSPCAGASPTWIGRCGATMFDPFAGLPRGHFGAILADPPWRFRAWNGNTKVQKRGSKTTYLAAEVYYNSMSADEISLLPVDELAAKDCVLFLWSTWPTLMDAVRIIERWGFTYKTCAFSWMKADPYRLFADEATPQMLMGYWTRANTEPCLLATRGKPKRLNADVRQGIIAPRREHSRKPDEIHGRIERLVAGPYLELFARAERPGWTVWGNETTKFTKPQPPSSEWQDMWAAPFKRPELT